MALVALAAIALGGPSDIPKNWKIVGAVEEDARMAEMVLLDRTGRYVYVSGVKHEGGFGRYDFQTKTWTNHINVFRRHESKGDVYRLSAKNLVPSGYVAADDRAVVFDGEDIVFKGLSALLRIEGGSVASSSWVLEPEVAANHPSTPKEVDAFMGKQFYWVPTGGKVPGWFLEGNVTQGAGPSSIDLWAGYPGDPAARRLEGITVPAGLKDLRVATNGTDPLHNRAFFIHDGGSEVLVVDLKSPMWKVVRQMKPDDPGEVTRNPDFFARLADGSIVTCRASRTGPDAHGTIYWPVASVYNPNTGAKSRYDITVRSGTPDGQYVIFSELPLDHLYLARVTPTPEK